ncbi:MAG: hypothetical protein ACK2UQ_11680 [Anaerolineae bacterium]
MDTQFVESFVNRRKQYFGEAELPIGYITTQIKYRQKTCARRNTISAA